MRRDSMFRPLVRRVTSAVLLLSILGFALPAAAAPAGRTQGSKVPVVFSSSLLDQIFSWLSGLWPGQEPKPQGSREKAGTINSGGSTEGAATLPEQERGGMIDPNGGW
jgi:hypothetical protein